MVFAALCLPFTTVPFSHSIGPSLVARYVCRYYSSVASCLERGIFFLFSFLVIYFYFYFFLLIGAGMDSPWRFGRDFKIFEDFKFNFAFA